jgi:hypothetical protein
MNPETFDTWLRAYGRAWEEGDADAAAALFTADAVYHETPFDPPMVGRAAIYDYWRAGAGESQRDVDFAYTILAWSPPSGLAHWTASFLRFPSGRVVRLDGILAAIFDEEGRCSLFREWWHRQEA